MRPPNLAISAQSATNRARPTGPAAPPSSLSGAGARRPPVASDGAFAAPPLAPGVALTRTAASADIHATLILKVPAYFFASLPSHSTPSISLAVRKGSLGSGV